MTNATKEIPPADDEVFDYYNAKSSKFYFDVETNGSLSALELILQESSVLHQISIKTNQVIRRSHAYLKSLAKLS